MQDSTTNVPRAIVTIALTVVIGILVYIMTTHKSPRPQDASIGVGSPVAINKTYTAPRRDISDDFDKFDDGLTRPSTEQQAEPDDFGVGVTNIRVYTHDLNNDGVLDRITRTHIENGTSHFTNEYKIELASGSGWVNITPDNFNTVESADCAIQKLRFYFDPVFTVEIIGRNIGETYATPTMAYRTIYQMTNNRLMKISHAPITETCDVSGLFN
ncbi:MAG: hypothetical protein K2M34_04545 [Alphaproteobacteria bacterium]|nr:hypothetical protein [Alphaproteobacteria bacterium]